MSNIQLYHQIMTLPQEMQHQIADFVEFLKYKNQNQNPKKRTAGLAKGLVEMTPDFEEPLEDFKDYV